MKPQIKAELQNLLEKIVSGKFIVTDIRNFLIFIREYVSKDSKLADICDLVAHPEREREDLQKN